MDEEMEIILTKRQQADLKELLNGLRHDYYVLGKEVDVINLIFADYDDYNLLFIALLTLDNLNKQKLGKLQNEIK